MLALSGKEQNRDVTPTSEENSTYEGHEEHEENLSDNGDPTRPCGLLI